MLLVFPTGINSIKSGDPLGAMVFYQDGTWNFSPHPDANSDDLEIMRDFVDFVSFSMTRDVHVNDFQEFQKKSDNEKIDTWRRENLRLVYNDSGSK